MAMPNMNEPRYFNIDNTFALFLKEDSSNVEEVVKKMKKPLKFKFEPVKDG